ncbi:phosphotriesterase [candidate division KSB1 bacterium]|nr:phosphotriesterase [candidate division KSB1 bacterium]
MKRKFIFLTVLSIFCVLSCDRASKPVIMTVNGPISPADLGVTLTHEHVLVDFIGADSVTADRYNADSVFFTVLPHLEQVHEAGCHTLVECTPAYLGRDPSLLHRLSLASRLHILTNTGYYGAMNNKYLPEYAKNETAEQLARRWIDEWENGIDETGIKPGFIKIGVASGSLSELHRKLVRAAALTHLKTGLIIAAHTGPAEGAFDEIDELQKSGVSANAFIWVHAQAEKNYEKHIEAAKSGAWISFDGYYSGKTEQYVEMLQNMKSNRLLSRVLLSHDAGWYHVGEPGGGNFRNYESVFKELLPALTENGFSQQEIDQMMVENPKQAFQIRVRKTTQ